MSALLEMRSITKEFPGVKALDRVSLTVGKPEIHAICGENGAGKSTLMKVLSGVYPYGTYEGDIYYKGELCQFKSISDSEHKGIVIIHQELALVPELSVMENMFLGNEVRKGIGIDWTEVRRRATELMERVGLKESPEAQVKNIGVGKQQLLEIAKALSKNVELLILDEPTSALNDNDSQHLLGLMAELKRQGVSCIMISHKLNEIEQISDKITIIRDGKSIETLDAITDGVNEDRIIKGMVGRDMESRFPPHTPKFGEVLFEVKDFWVKHPVSEDRYVCKGSSIKVRRGEIVGIAGLMGAGRTELAMSIFGHSYGLFESGSVYLNGEEIDTSTVDKAIANGLAYVSEDRKSVGLNLLDDIQNTTVSAKLSKVSSRGVIDKHQVYEEAEKYRKRLRTKAPSVREGVDKLSGGNQQKVVLSKWMFTDPDVLILDEPTRGIDVGAKYEIYEVIFELARQGKGVIVISSELPEVLGLTDRIYTVFEGQITADVMADEATQESLMKNMTSARVRN